MLQKLSWLLIGTFTLLSWVKTNKTTLPNPPFKGFQQPQNFPAPIYPVAAFPVTEAGFMLGRQLFYDAILSRDNTISCGSCHIQSAAFTHHGHDLSHGIEDRLGSRNAPPLQNLAFYSAFMWDGGVHNLDLQPIAPIENQVEMDEKLPVVLEKLRKHPTYPLLFEKVFGNKTINSTRMLQALSQFMVMLVSANSKYDKVLRHEGVTFTPDETDGYRVFIQKCNSCHTEPLFTNQSYRNNGIGGESNNDLGRYSISLKEIDSFAFKVPSLRNVMLTSPYMHDGRLRTIDAVLTHYSKEVKQTLYLDPLLQKRNNGQLGIPLDSVEKRQLKAFLETLTDEEFIRNSQFAEQ